MKSEIKYKFIIVFLLVVIVVGITKYINDTNKLKSEVGRHYTNAFALLLKLNTGPLKEHLQENDVPDTEFLRKEARSYYHLSENIGMYYSWSRIPMFIDFGDNMRNKLLELAKLIERNTEKEKQDELKNEILSDLGKGYDTWEFLRQEIENTISSDKRYNIEIFRRFKNPSQKLNGKITELLQGFE